MTPYRLYYPTQDKDSDGDTPSSFVTDTHLSTLAKETWESLAHSYSILRRYSGTEKKRIETITGSRKKVTSEESWTGFAVVDFLVRNNTFYFAKEGKYLSV